MQWFKLAVGIREAALARELKVRGIPRHVEVFERQQAPTAHRRSWDTTWNWMAETMAASIAALDLAPNDEVTVYYLPGASRATPRRREVDRRRYRRKINEGIARSRRAMRCDSSGLMPGPV